MTDHELWSQLKAGEKKALEQIYRSQIDYLLQYGTKFTADCTQVEDCIHDLFVEIWKNRRRIGQTDSIRAYLLVALRRSLIKRIKKRQKIKSDDEVKEIEFRPELAIDELIISRELTEEKAALLKAALEKLSSRQREILYLRFYQDMNLKDIGEAMGIS